MLIGEVISTSQFLLEDGRWVDCPYKVGQYVVYAIHAGAGAIWQDEIKNTTGMFEAYNYRMVKWTEILGIYKA